MIGGVPVVESKAVPDGMVLVVGRNEMYVIGTCPRSELDLARHRARWLVRRGLADVLEWLGEDVGPEHPATGAQILARLRGDAR